MRNTASIWLFGVLCVAVHGQQPWNGLKIDCHPDANANQQNCQARGCVWQASTVPNEPWCYYDGSNPGSMAGYDASNVQSGSNSMSATLTRRSTPTIFGDEIGTLNLQVKYLSDFEVRIQITPTGMKTFEPIQATRNASMARSVRDSNSALYSVTVQQSPFGIAVTRKSSGTVLFDTRNLPGFVFAKQFLQLTTRTPTFNVYGFGENTHQDLKLDMNWRKWGMFSRDEPVTGSTMNLYGVHPFYMCLENDGNAHGVLFFNSHAQHVELAPYPTITHRSIGGSFDIQIFLGPRPEQVVQEYVGSIGLPMMPPYWALGFHICRYGYPNLAAVQNVVKRNRQAGIPYDTQWIDIDHMNQRMDFTYDTVNFAGLPQFAQDLHNENMKLILIEDPCIASQPNGNYPALTQGLQQHAFITDARTGQPLEGSVWPGKTYFPDFTSQQAIQYWTQQCSNFHDTVNFDALWIDMNEPSSFSWGSTTGCAQNSLNNPPFNPLLDQTLYAKTICMDANQAWGKHYDVHSETGYAESIATFQALKSVFPGKRPLVLSRSTFVGSGQYAAHWTGDNNSNWPQMKWSIATMLEFGMFGIPLIGADICGFNGASTEELCVRWQQLGAFYPFSRNHNAINQPDQDPAVWSPQSVQAIKKALTTRYQLLPHLYTLLYWAHVQGSTVARPVFFEFPTDANTAAIDDQFLWGSGFMVVPILEQGATQRQAYFPTGRWFDFYTGQEVANPSAGRSVNLNIDISSIALFVRGGTIIPWQTPAQTTVDSRLNPMGLLVALDSNQAATGTLFWDDGITINTDSTGAFTLLTFNATLRNGEYGSLTIQKITSGYSDSSVFGAVYIFGLMAQPKGVQVNGQGVPDGNVVFDYNNKAVKITGLNIPVTSASSQQQLIQWYY